MTGSATRCRLEQLEREVASARAELQRARAAAEAVAEGVKTGRWRHLQEENDELRLRRARLQEEVTRLHRQAREHGESGADGLASLLDLFNGD
jgi:predicted  nucleic acid-binding Zn-ribbon protein